MNYHLILINCNLKSYFMKKVISIVIHWYVENLKEDKAKWLKGISTAHSFGHSHLNYYLNSTIRICQTNELLLRLL